MNSNRCRAVTAHFKSIVKDTSPYGRYQFKSISPGIPLDLTLSLLVRVKPLFVRPQTRRPKAFPEVQFASRFWSFEIYTADTNCILNVKSGDPELAQMVAKKCLSLDLDTSGFYEKISGHEEFQWMIDQKMGRYLRSPTLFEDCFKIIATCNADWFSKQSCVQNQPLVKILID